MCAAAAASDQPRTLDLNKVVQEWAVRRFDETATRRQKRIRQKELRKKEKYIDTVFFWQHVRFSHATSWPDGVREDATSRGKRNVSILFHTTFENKTKKNQQYTMRTDKTTRSTASVELATSWSKEMECGASIKCPGDILEFNAGFKKELSVSRTDTEEIEEEVQWGVESGIVVRAGHLAEASLLVEEKKFSGDFNVTSRFAGQVMVHYHNLKDNNALLKATSGDIAAIVKDFVEREKKKSRLYGHFVSFNDAGDEVTVVTQGNCKFSFGVKQQVQVKETQLPGYEANGDED